MEEVALRLVEEPLPVDKKALAYSEIIRALPPIKTANEYVYVGELWKDGKALLKEIDDGYDDLIKAAHKLHKDAVAKKAKYYAPTDAGVRAAKQLMSDYDQAQERLRKAEEARLLAIQKAEEEKARQIEIDCLKAEAKAEEDRLMEAALAAEQAGDKQTAEVLTAAAVNVTEEVKQESAAILAAPVQATVVLPKSTPKVAGISYSTRWSASVTDIKALCLAIGTGRASTEFVIGLDRDKDGIVTSPALNKQATSLKDTLCIPGVIAVSKRC